MKNGGIKKWKMAVKNKKMAEKGTMAVKRNENGGKKWKMAV